jgi:hypothetical protein
LESFEAERMAITEPSSDIATDMPNAKRNDPGEEGYDTTWGMVTSPPTLTHSDPDDSS